MSKVIIKTNMETMPKDCVDCLCGERYGAVGEVKCRVLPAMRDYDCYFIGPGRPEKCPLQMVETGEEAKDG